MTKSKFTNDKRANKIAPDPGAQLRGLLHNTNCRIEIASVAQLTDYKGNSRTHSPKQIRKIAASITRFGFCNPILIDDHKRIIAGHGRLEAAKLLGIKAVPTLRLSHLSDIEKRAYAIADNRLAEQAGWDRNMLAIELQALVDLNFEVEITGFDIGDVDIILKGVDDDRSGEADRASATLEPPSQRPVSQAGDQWILGEHRLICGRAQRECAYAAVDAAVRCWQRFTGQSATLAKIGKTFDEVARERAGTKALDAARKSSVTAKREAA